MFHCVPACGGSPFPYFPSEVLHSHLPKDECHRPTFLRRWHDVSSTPMTCLATRHNSALHHQQSSNDPDDKGCHHPKYYCQRRTRSRGRSSVQWQQEFVLSRPTFPAGLQCPADNLRQLAQYHRFAILLPGLHSKH